MTAAALLVELRNRGASVAVIGDRLRIEAPPGAVTQAMREDLRAHKAHLLQLLRLTRIEAIWKPDEWLAYQEGGRLVTARYAGISTEGRVNVWLADGAVRAVPAEAVALDWCPDAAELFEERLSIMLEAGVPEDVARERAEVCTLEYVDRLRGCGA